MLTFVISPLVVKVVLKNKAYYNKHRYCICTLFTSVVIKVLFKKIQQIVLAEYSKFTLPITHLE